MIEVKQRWASSIIILVTPKKQYNKYERKKIIKSVTYDTDFYLVPNTDVLLPY